MIHFFPPPRNSLGMLLRVNHIDGYWSEYVKGKTNLILHMENEWDKEEKEGKIVIMKLFWKNGQIFKFSLG